MNNEPVAWYYENKNGVSWVSGTREKHDKNFVAVEKPIYTHPAKTLTDAVVNELWAESQEDGIAMQQGFTTQQHYFAYLILRKAQEI